jgi:hypothetical protein
LEVDGGHGNGGGFSGAEEGLYRLSSVGEEVTILYICYAFFVCYELSPLFL